MSSAEIVSNIQEQIISIKKHKEALKNNRKNEEDELEASINMLENFKKNSKNNRIESRQEKDLDENIIKTSNFNQSNLNTNTNYSSNPSIGNNYSKDNNFNTFYKEDKMEFLTNENDVNIEYNSFLARNKGTSLNDGPFKLRSPDIVQPNKNLQFDNNSLENNKLKKTKYENFLSELDQKTIHEQKDKPSILNKMGSKQLQDYEYSAYSQPQIRDFSTNINNINNINSSNFYAPEKYERQDKYDKSEKDDISCKTSKNKPKSFLSKAEEKNINFEQRKNEKKAELMDILAGQSEKNKLGYKDSTGQEFSCKVLI